MCLSEDMISLSFSACLYRIVIKLKLSILVNQHIMVKLKGQIFQLMVRRTAIQELNPRSDKSAPTKPVFFCNPLPCAISSYTDPSVQLCTFSVD